MRNWFEWKSIGDANCKGVLLLSLLTFIDHLLSVRWYLQCLIVLALSLQVALSRNSLHLESISVERRMTSVSDYSPIFLLTLSRAAQRSVMHNHSCTFLARSFARKQTSEISNLSSVRSSMFKRFWKLVVHNCVRRSISTFTHSGSL